MRATKVALMESSQKTDLDNYGLLIATAAATAAASTAATTTPATTAAATPVTAATTTATAIFARLGFVDSQGTTTMLLIVQATNRGLRLGIAPHLDKAEALAAARVAILDHLGTLNRSESSEQLF